MIPGDEADPLSLGTELPSGNQVAVDGAAVGGTEPDSEIAESLSMRHDLTDGHGEGVASPDYLWWPPHKVGGPSLAPWLAGNEDRGLRR